MGKTLIHKARKRFGQNFLHDQNIIGRIISSIAPTSEQHIVEIGPGKGALTEHLVIAAGKLDVIELDRDLVPYLQERFSACEQISIHNADALQFDFSLLQQDSLQKKSKLRLVGNLPYNIATPLIFHLLADVSMIEDMHFMLQKEVVERLTARPGNKLYGRLSILVQYLCHAELLFIVPPSAFTPVPKVDSAIVRLTPRKSIKEEVKLQNATATTPAATLEDLTFIAKAAFSQRRKTLRNNLQKILTVEQITQCNIDPGRRAETLSISEFVSLTNRYVQLRVI